jgi:hypothetical protein
MVSPGKIPLFVAVLLLALGAEAAGPSSIEARISACERDVASHRQYFREAIKALSAGQLRAKGWEVTLGARLGQLLGGGFTLGLGRVRDSHGRGQWRLFRATPSVDVNASQIVPLSLGLHLRKGFRAGQTARDLDSCEVKVGGGACAVVGGRGYVGRGEGHRVLSFYADVGAGHAAGLEVSRPVTLLGTKPRPERLARRILEGYRLAGQIKKALAEARGSSPEKAAALLKQADEKMTRLKGLRSFAVKKLFKRLVPASERRKKSKGVERGGLMKPLGALALAGLLMANNAPLITGGLDPTPYHSQVAEMVLDRPSQEQRDLLARDPRKVLSEELKRAAESSVDQAAQFREVPYSATALRVGGNLANDVSRLFLTTRAAFYDTTNKLANDLRLHRCVTSMYSVLDPAGMVYFRHDVKALMKKPEVLRFLTELNQQLAQPAGRVDLFKLAQKHSGNAEEAARWLGVLFQDLHRGTYPAGLLLRDPAQQRLLDTVALQLSKADPARVARLPGSWYPTKRNSGNDDEVYHYWVIRHLAGALRGRGHRAADAFLAPFLLNTEYELAGYTLPRLTFHAPAGAPEGLARAIWDGPKAPLSENDLSAVEHEHHLRHIYMGYRGAMDGAGVKATPMSYESFREMMNRDHVAGIRSVLSQARAEQSAAR